MVLPLKETSRLHHPPHPHSLKMKILVDLSTSALSNPQAHLSLGKARLTHLNNLKPLKLFPLAGELRVRMGSGSREGAQPPGPKVASPFGMRNSQLVSAQEGENGFYFAFSNRSPIVHGTSESGTW